MRRLFAGESCWFRMGVIAGIIVVLFVLLGWRLVRAHCFPDEFVTAAAKAHQYRRELPYYRGRVVDRRGITLAQDVMMQHLCADPLDIKENGNMQEVSLWLNNAFGIDQGQLLDKIFRNEGRYVRLLTYLPWDQTTAFSQGRFGLNYVIGGHTNFLRGLSFEDAPLRSYPVNGLMSHVVGVPAKESRKGLSGIEYRFDKYLTGKNGWIAGEKDARNREIFSRRKQKKEPTHGVTVQLALDVRLQNVVENVLADVCQTHCAQAAWAIVQNVHTGEILAMASWPTFNSNQMEDADASSLENRAISFMVEPGSTLKTAVIASAIDLGVVTPQTGFDCEHGEWRYGGEVLHDSHPKGQLSVADILKVSSNIGAAKVALSMSEDDLYRKLSEFGLGSRLGIDLPGEHRGMLHSPEEWSKISATRIAMGHEVGATALQVLSMMSAIANDGVLMRPLVVSRVGTEEDPIVEFEPEVLSRPIRASTARVMQQLLRRVVEDGGTGTQARISEVSVAGKTGTAQKVRPPNEGGGYYQKRFIASFAGFVPAEAPEYAIIVMVDDPGTVTPSGRKTGYSGGYVCAPAFGKIASAVIRLLGYGSNGAYWID